MGPKTIAARREGALIYVSAVEQAVVAMRARPEERLPLAAMAETARLSPHHFGRIFREVTGVSPGRFRRALRMERATKLLLTADLGILDVADEVGYASPGSFATAFTRLVGVSPGWLRGLPSRLRPVLGALNVPRPVATPGGAAATVAGRVVAPDGPAWLFVGLFPDGAPRGQPTVCTICEGEGPFTLEGVPAASYRLRVASLPASRDPLDLLLPGPARRVGSADGPITVGTERVVDAGDVTVHPQRLIDPPFLLRLPAILPGWLARGGATVA